MKIAPRDAENFVANPPAAIRAVLLFGENAGLAREYADAIAMRIVPNLKDSDRIVDLAPAEIRKDAARLSDEASQMSMFSPGRRVVRIRDASEGMGEHFAGFLKESPGDALVIVEAAELSAKASLRAVFEQSSNAAAIACYDDGLETLVKLATTELKKTGIQFEDGAPEALVARMGTDRRLLRGELQKIALFFQDVPQGSRLLSNKLIDDFLGQSGEVEANAISAAAATGDHRQLDRLLIQAEEAGGSPSYLVSATLRHLHALLAARAHGQADDAVSIARSRGLWGHSDAAIRSQLGKWSLQRLTAAVRVLGQAEVALRSNVWPEWSVAARALLQTARLAQ